MMTFSSTSSSLQSSLNSNPSSNEHSPLLTRSLSEGQEALLPTSAKTFQTFLSERAPSKETGGGFSVSDHLKYRYIQFITTKGLMNQILAFIYGGGVGYFFSERVDDSNREMLKKESKFYFQCCKVQACYRDFINKPDAALDTLKEAYETLISMGNNAEDHTWINQIVDQHFAGKSSIGGAILEKVAKNAFTSEQGQFNIESILRTINGQPFVDHLNELHKQGYRVAVTAHEDTVRNTTTQTGHIVHSVDENNYGVFTAYARAFGKLLPYDPYIGDTVSKYVKPTHISIENEIKQHTQLIQNLITTRSNDITEADLPPLLQIPTTVGQINDARKEYILYRELQCKRNDLDLEINKLRADTTYLISINTILTSLKLPDNLDEITELKNKYEQFKKKRLELFLEEVEKNVAECSNPEELEAVGKEYETARQEFIKALGPLLEIGNKTQIAVEALKGVNLYPKNIYPLHETYQETIGQFLTPEELKSLPPADFSKFKEHLQSLAQNYSNRKQNKNKIKEELKTTDLLIKKKEEHLKKFGFSGLPKVDSLTYAFPEDYAKNMSTVLSIKAELISQAVDSLELLSMDKSGLRGFNIARRSNPPVENLQDLEASSSSDDE